MRIIENNYGNIRCPMCDSVFQLEKGDLKTSWHDPEYYFICPVCGHTKWYDEDHPYVEASKTGIMVHK